METIVRLTGKQHRALEHHLFPGDGKEAVAVILCGRHYGADRHILTGRRIELIPYDQCSIRTDQRVSWSTESLTPLLVEASRKGFAIVKVHSHPTGYPTFSAVDDHSDHELFTSVHGWTDGDQPHASIVMLPGGDLFGRGIMSDGSFEPLSLLTVAGDDLKFYWDSSVGMAGQSSIPAYEAKNAQVFGRKTTGLMKRLSIAVIGCSGTGSPVIEQLVRLGVGRIVLVDPDFILEKNLNRIINAMMHHAAERVPKVEVLAQAIEAMGLGTTVSPIPKSLFNADVVRAVAGCDVVFGCMDGVEGRHVCNKLAAFYNLPYFDVGIKLEADGAGGIDQVCGAIHYLQADGSSLLSRGVYTMEDVRAESLRRTDPATYEQRVREKYIKGVQEERPAVISINMQFAAMVVNEFLARLHPYRNDSNAEYAAQYVSLTDGYSIKEPDGTPCDALARHVGRGDVVPLLDMPALSE